MCNLLNVARAFNYVGAEAGLQTMFKQHASDRLVVPGGAFRDCMKELSQRGFNDIRLFAGTDRPLL